MLITDTDGRQHELADAYVLAAVRRLRSSGRGNRTIDLGGDGPITHVTVSDEEAGRIVAEYEGLTPRPAPKPTQVARYDDYLAITAVDKGNPLPLLSIYGADHLGRHGEIDWLIEQLQYFRSTGRLFPGTPSVKTRHADREGNR